MNLKDLLNLPLKWHLVIGSLIRLVLILYAEYHDKYSEVPYTDVDYKVFTDAARHVFYGKSPYKRHTYRYSPLIAYMLVPNLFFGKYFGKVLFSFFDNLITVSIHMLIRCQLLPQAKNKENAEKVALFCSLFWLYNPMSIAISTRGNADSIPCLCIILALLFLETHITTGRPKYIIAGIFLGVAIHLRIYPIVFSLPMYLSLGEYNFDRNITFRDYVQSLLPNERQLTLTVACITTLGSLTHEMYSLYGYDFLFETYIYHIFRKDTRHNFSVLFYYSYLTAGNVNVDPVKICIQTFEMIILGGLSLVFGTSPKTLHFCLFCQAVVLVAYNSVLTSQYFIWFLSLLPLVVHNLRIKPPRAVLFSIIWFLAQGAWLFYAYLVEFKSREVFIMIWLKGIVFFCSNVYVLGKIIQSFSTTYAFGYRDVIPIPREVRDD
ncbi:hypothetical protein JYU34_022157 [Plutella xylostella]|uniref:GPI alpha-1,4-mannosyltransferase I, catalytic subunit n=1 Tax=Plutella xylostella TaxID=51655 RepID=A0ABQ7PQW8_PLUXY|nr:GPI mannosyltransferase 1 [Plutella xylostella]KAG7295188.1 hypothetical protein JYU34_022157 [Plutella xylostella]